MDTLIVGMPATDCMAMVRVSELMTKDVVHTIGQDASVEEAARRMRNVGRGCLVVIEEGRVVGILTATDFAKRLLTRAGSDPMLAAMARAAQLLSQSSEV